MGRETSSAHVDTAVFLQLREENTVLKQENEELRRKLERMNELLLKAQRAQFGQSSEKRSYVMPNQLGMFNEDGGGAGPQGSGTYRRNPDSKGAPAQA